MSTKQMEDSDTIFKSAMTLYQEANELRNQGDYFGALERFAQVHSIDPDFDQHFRYADFYNDWGRALSSVKRYPEAIEKFEKALAIEPDNGSAYSAIAEAYLGMEDNESAQRFFEKASQAYNTFHERKGAGDYAEYFYFDWALTELRLGRIESAIAQFENSMRVRPDFPEPYAALSALYKHLGNIEKAESLHQQALSMNEQTVASVVPVVESILSGRKNESIQDAGNQPDSSFSNNGTQRNDKTRPRFSGYHPDITSGEDRLNITSDVNMLCDLIMAKSWSPPLSIGLFGDWGTGKSFFMDKMKDRITLINKESGHAHQKNIVSLYSRDVIQVTYNAWQYQDSNVFASIASTIFDTISKELYGKTIAETLDYEQDKKHQENLHNLFNNLNITKQQIESHLSQKHQITELQNDLNNKIDGLKSKEKSLCLDLQDLKHVLSDELLEKIQSDISSNSEVIKAYKKLGLQSDATEIKKLIKDAIYTSRTPVSKVFSFFKLPHKDKLMTIGVIALFAIVSVVISRIFTIFDTNIHKFVGIAVPLLGTIAGAITSIYSIIKPYLNKVEPLYKAAKSRYYREISSLEIDLQHQNELVKSTEQSLNTLAETANTLQSQINQIQQGCGLSGFLHSRAVSSDYSKKRGIIATVRDDFEELSKKLPNNLEGESSKRIERIVIYIDDLDRCDPDRVVDVLEAVHLFMSINIMVVVVAVDPRWLHNALWVHLDRFARAHESHRGKSDDFAFIGQTATPQNYLEKIFQIPFTLRPMSREGFSSLITDMMSKQGQPAESAGLPLEEINKQSNPGIPSPSYGKPIRSAAILQSTEKATSINNEIEPSIDLMPQYLEVSEKEVNGLASMGALIDTPRAAKRMVNIYRLIRTTLNAEQLDMFNMYEFNIVQFLLGILIGCPEQADLFYSSLQKTDSDTIGSYVGKLDENNDSLMYVQKKVLKTWSPEHLNTLNIQLCKYWIPAVARYSFETESTVFKR